MTNADKYKRRTERMAAFRKWCRFLGEGSRCDGCQFDKAFDGCYERWLGLDADGGASAASDLADCLAFVRAQGFTATADGGGGKQ